MKFDWKTVRKIIVITLGAILFAFALEAFLVPNQIIDGGIVGVSLLTSHLTGINFGILLIALNIPFLIMGYRQLGKTFVLLTTYAIVLASIATQYMHHIKPVTTDPLLGAIFGGILLGIGIGMVIRSGGSLDGTEIVAIMFNKKSPFSVGETVMFFNVFILGAAGFIFSWESAMYSMLAYFIAFKTIDLTISGLEEMRSATIISDYHEEIGDAMLHRLGRTVTYYEGIGGISKEPKKSVYCIFSRLEESKLKTIIQEIDPNAFIIIEHVSEVIGEGFKKSSIH